MKTTKIHIPDHALNKKIVTTLIVFPLFVLIPFTFLFTIPWNYFTISTFNQFGWERVLNTSFYQFPEVGEAFFTPLVLVLCAEAICFTLYLFHLRPIFHYISTGEEPDQAEKAIYTGFGVLFWPGFLIGSILKYFLYKGDTAINPNHMPFYQILNVLSTGIYLTILILCAVLVIRIAANPVVAMINRKKISYKETYFLDLILPYLPGILFAAGMFTIFFRLVNFFIFYGGQVDNTDIPPMTQEYFIAAIMVGSFSVLIIILNSLITFLDRLERVPLKQQLEQLSQQGADLSYRITIPAHNIQGLFASEFNGFLERFQRQILRLKTFAVDMKKGAENLHANYTLISDAENIQKREIAPVSSSVSDVSIGMSNLINEVKGKYDDISENLSNVDSISERVEQIILIFQEIKKQSVTSLATANIITKQIQDSIEKSQKMTESMALISKRIQEAGKEAEHIDEILTLIQDISEQTNILSINAAIEAAHAGDDGKGFAIVANEVRTLATESSKAVEHISQKLIDIRRIIRNSVELTLSAETITQENNSLVQETFSVITQMIEQFQKTGQITENTANAITHQAAITRNFRNQIRLLMFFFQDLKSSMIGQEEAFSHLDGTLQTLKDSIAIVSDHNVKVKISVDMVSQTESSFSDLVSLFKTE